MADQNHSSTENKPVFTLKAETGPLAGRSITLKSATLTIGRESNADLLVDQEQVSRQHARLTWTGSAWMLEDLNSSNGTFVNGRRIHGTAPVRPGDRIGFGTEVLFQLGTSQASSAGAGAVPGAAASGSTPRKRKSPLRWFLPLAALLILIVGAAGAAWYFFLRTPAERTRPVVWFENPNHNSHFRSGDDLSIYAVAEGNAKISRFELWLDGSLVEVRNSDLPDGTSPFPMVSVLQISDPGEHTLIARAFNTDGERAHASVTVTAETVSDLDEDGVPDDEDACPSEGGLAGADGCPDADGDGIADAEDACPDEAGLPGAEGCPVPTEGDRDGDGLADEADRCPDTPGAPRSEGCPDADGDSIPDVEDACPDEPGVPGGDGCPDDIPDGGDGDRDSDGIDDIEDACPDEPGAPSADGCPDSDGDSIPDSEDACPEEPGAPGAEDGEGCPAPGEGDADGDGIPDAEDTCPEEPGAFGAEGCPDRDGDSVPDTDDPCPDDAGVGGEACPADPAEDGDGGIPGGGPGDDDTDGDGVPDREDLCPEEPGSAENGGCPDSGSGDSDGDGIEDDVDLCPDEAGLPEHGGCPPPGEGEDSDGDGIPDDAEGDDSPFGEVEPFLPGDEPLPFHTPIEFEALTFSVDQVYSEIYCYASLAGAPMDRFGPFDPLGENQWDIAEHLGGENSRHVSLPDDEALEVRAECYGDVISAGPEGLTSRTDDLGTIYALHPSEDWDGHVVETTSAAGESGEQFDVSYRMCTPSCDEAELRAPTLRLLHGGGDHRLMLGWDGDRTEISGFRIYMNGSRQYEVTSNLYSQSVASYEPMCGTDTRREFYITAYVGDRESAPSNLAYWSSRECPRRITVTFQGLSFYDMGGDERYAEGSNGPIYGSFFAAGSNHETVSFYAVDPPDTWGGRSHGFRVRNTRYYEVQGILDWVHTQNASCIGNGCSIYSGSTSSTVTIDLEPYQDLTFGGYVKDFDTNNEDDTLFEDERTLSHDEIRPGLFSIFSGNVNLTVLIDVIVGPEVGENPDLTITDVTQHEDSGQLRIHVFNNASGMVGVDLPVRLERLDGTHVLTQTWEDLSLASGGSAILMSSEVVMEASDLRVILDPDNAIVEENENNNTYETPVTMRVEFIRAWAPHCNECSCSIFDCDSEHVFQVWAGYGPDRREVEWVGYNVRFPRDDHLRACGSPCTSDPDEDWYMEGDDRYTFEFEMPADELLYVMVTGHEKDNATNNDSLGYVLHSYNMDQNWGDSDDTYSDNYGEETICDDANCSECHEGLTAWWRISRIH